MYENTNCLTEKPNVSKEVSCRDSIQETKKLLAELLVMMGDTSMQLFEDSPVEKTDALEGRCFADDVRTVNRQVVMALSLMNDIRRKMLG